MNPLLVQEAAAALLSSAGRSNLKNLVSMVAVGLLIFFGLGYYLDWYKIQRTPGPDGQQNITLGVNTNEIKKDFAIVRDKAGQIINGKPTGYQSPTAPTYPPNYQPQYPTQAPYPQTPYPQTQYPTQPYPAQYPPTNTQPQQQPGYYPPAQPQSNWTPTQPASRPVYPQTGARPF